MHGSHLRTREIWRTASHRLTTWQLQAEQDIAKRAPKLLDSLSFFSLEEPLFKWGLSLDAGCYTVHTNLPSRLAEPLCPEPDLFRCYQIRIHPSCLEIGYCNPDQEFAEGTIPELLASRVIRITGPGRVDALMSLIAEKLVARKVTPIVMRQKLSFPSMTGSLLGVSPLRGPVGEPHRIQS